MLCWMLCRTGILPGDLANKAGLEPKRSVKPSESQAYRSWAAGVPAMLGTCVSDARMHA